MTKFISALTARKYVGEFSNSYFGYSLLNTVREHAASGGVTSTLLIGALRAKRIDGALLCRSFIEDNSVQTEYFIARTEEEIVQAQGSKYLAANFGFKAVPLIRGFEGKLAVVGLPCDALVLHQLRERYPEIDHKIALVITLFCGHNSEKELTNLVLKKLNPKHKKIVDYRYRFGHWRGNLKVTFEDGQEVIKPFNYFSDYQNLYFFSEPKCLQCADQTGIYSDISIGDIWAQKMKANPVKHNAILVRSAIGQEMVDWVRENQLANMFPVPFSDIWSGQSRSLPIHSNVNARAWAGRCFGLKLKPVSDEKPTLLDKAVAWVICFNFWFSHRAMGRKIIPVLPRFMIKLYLYFFKGIQIMLKPKPVNKIIGIMAGSIWGNRGAEAMLVTTIGILKEKYPDADFRVFSIYPKKDRELIRDPRIDVMSSKPIALLTRYFPFAVLDWIFSLLGIRPWNPSAARRMRDCSVMIDIGGITFAERGTILLYNIFSIWSAILLDIPVIKLSQAMGPFKSAMNRAAARIFLSRCQQIYARGEITANYIAHLDNLRTSSQIAADIAFNYVPEYSLSIENPEKIKDLVDSLEAFKVDGKKVVVFAPSTVVSRKFEGPAFENLFLDTIQKMDRPELHYVFLPNSNRAGIEKPQNNDIFIISKIRALAEKRFSKDQLERIIWIDWDINAAGICQVIDRANLVVTCRLHAMVLSLNRGVPVYVVGWSHKYQEILKMFDLEKNAVDYNQVSAELLSDQIKFNLENEKKIRDQIAAFLPAVKRSSLIQFENLDIHFRE
jgi:coenzyme F420-reducing hydrogenase beta subunit/polysaccharide pyruvyl transferase WcaK-like protein